MKLMIAAALLASAWPLRGQVLTHALSIDERFQLILADFARDYKVQKAQALATARHYPDSHRAQFGLGSGDSPVVAQVEYHEQSDTWHVSHQAQLHDGVAVERTEIHIVIRQGRVKGVSGSGRWIPGLQVSGTPTIGQEQAQDVLWKLAVPCVMPGWPPPDAPGPDCPILPDDVDRVDLVFANFLEDPPIVPLTWKFTVRRQMGAVIEVYIDAHTGSLFRVHDTAIY